MDTNSTEIWKTIEPTSDGRGYYQVNQFGKIRKITEVSVFEKDNGYLTCHINRKNKYVHRLVAEAFIDNNNLLPTVNHKDKNRKNNNVSNLEWMLYSENNAHGQCQIIAGKSKRIPVLQYDKNGIFVKEWPCGKIAAETLKIDASGITACCKGKQKTSGKYIWKYKNEPDMAKLADELYEKLNSVNK